MYGKIWLKGYIRGRAHHSLIHDPRGMSKKEVDTIINDFKRAFERTIIKLEYILQD